MNDAIKSETTRHYYNSRMLEKYLEETGLSDKEAA